jgi:2-polyprenyl-3-methyl-5-hydroxy-6-metoxy-1,4-benzoquinol methylase
MTQERMFPDWEELYRNDGVEQLPWYCAPLDPDLETALERHGIRQARVLDQGTGPGTQAMALAERGFLVTGSDVSAAAVEYAARKAAARGVRVTFVQDDIRTTRLAGPFDVVFDRGCFHVLKPARRPAYVETMRRLLAPSGWLFLKTFSHQQFGEFGPYRFAPDEIRQLFDDAAGFRVLDVVDTVFQGQLDPYPKALFASIQRV